MAQALSATGMSPERAFELARPDRGAARRARRGRDRRAAPSGPGRGGADGRGGRHRGAALPGWRRLDRLDRPLVVLIGGTTGVGKSTLATMLAGRLGVNRVIATDVIRQVLRAFFTTEAMPTVHHSAFEAGGIEGYRDQAERVGTGIAAIVERAANEAKPVVVEGVHVVPGRRPPARARALRAGGGARGGGGPRSAQGPLRPASRHAPGGALPGALRGHPASAGPPLGAGALGGVAVIDNEQRGRHAGPPDGAGAGRGRGGPLSRRRVRRRSCPC